MLKGSDTIRAYHGDNTPRPVGATPSADPAAGFEELMWVGHQSQEEALMGSLPTAASPSLLPKPKNGACRRAE